ncbi:EAL domain-containing protein [Granulosicoccaceae sp. 1_MG-2023]|nr:EAL domain-containing protein [Granulosicoccaceae sp. 1_MG-2023]
MLQINREPAISRLEIASYLAILLIGLWFAYFVHKKSEFSESDTAQVLIEKQAQLGQVSSALEKVHQTLQLERNFGSATGLQRISAVIAEARRHIGTTTVESTGGNSLAAEQLLSTIDKWLTNETPRGIPLTSTKAYRLSVEALEDSLDDMRAEQQRLAAAQHKLIASYKDRFSSFRVSVLTLLLGSMSLIVLVISLNIKQRQTQTKLANERKLISDSVNNLEEGVVLTDSEDRCLVINETLGRICPKLRARLKIDQSFEDAFARSINRGDMRLIEVQTHHLIESDVVSAGTNRNETPREYMTESGIYLRVTKRDAENGSRIITFSDITYLKLAQRQLHHQATKDGLTGLANRNHFLEQLESALAGSRRHGHKVALMLFDLDKFKQVNDTLGHAVGDELLRTVANRIRENLREIDVSARMGGDEFAAFLDQIKDVREVRITADRILKQLHQRLEIEGIDVEVSSSIGIALFPDDASNLSTLLKQADSACYHAKQLGRNNYQIFNRDMKIRAMQQMTMESRLRTALADNALSLSFQPQLDLQTGQYCGMEAFLRWKDHKLGSVRPDHFIPIAEKTGLIAEIGEWVIREACKQIRHWMDAGQEPMQLAVNISPRQFRLQNLPVIVDKALGDFDVDPSLLAFEITESIIMNDLSTSVDTLKELGARGVTLVIDDFGAGSSSLYRLKELPIHALKIDQSFVNSMLDNADSREITAAIIAIAQQLKLRTIAEGVETREQQDLLQTLGCDAVQGYLIHKPTDASEIDRLISLPPAANTMQAG